MQILREKGVNFAEVTLHVGLGTFRPVKENDVLDHKMHSEWYSISDRSGKSYLRSKKERPSRDCRRHNQLPHFRSRRYRARRNNRVQGQHWNIYLSGYQYKCIDGLITNFHLPESTLIMLVSAFCSYEYTMHAYRVAVEEKYRFFSFGDAMLII